MEEKDGKERGRSRRNSLDHRGWKYGLHERTMARKTRCEPVGVRFLENSGRFRRFYLDCTLYVRPFDCMSLYESVRCACVSVKMVLVSNALSSNIVCKSDVGGSC
uniref:Uncharacterized protein n=1 Tax=Vespula pensylvanica TaxID=30213 RepID=A0A834JPG9_VESPE|nr:hypothetical protein H0235_017686 [Vespula pensylvanica]